MGSVLKEIRDCAAKAKRLRHLNFLITETLEMAEKHCEQAISRDLHPFRMVIKDNYTVKDVPMTCASKMLCNFVPPYTATCVQRLLDHGGCLLGKSNMDEFAMGSTTSTGYFGPVLHYSYADEVNFKMGCDYRIAGGSSGGCAVAVAVGVAEVAIGSDTGGSIRYPAALNGVYGFKPSYGRLSRHGLVPLVNALDTPSILTATLSTCKFYYNILKGHDPMDSTTLTDAVDQGKPTRKRIESPKHLVVGVPRQTAIEQLASEGATVREVLLPHSEYAINCYSIVDMDIASNMARYDGIRYGHRINKLEECSYFEQITRNRTEGFNKSVKRRIIAGNFYALEENYKKYVEQAVKVQRLIQRDFVEAFRQVDCILTPVTRHSAPMLSEVVQRTREEQRLDDYFVLPSNLCGIFVQFPTKIPLLQRIAPYLEDDRLLEIAEFFNQ